MPSHRPAASRPDPPPPWRARLGKVLDRLGQYGLPLAVGLGLGYWLADFGTAWLPDMLELLSVQLLASLALILAGVWLRGKHVQEGPEGPRVRRRILVLLSLSLVAVGIRLAVYWARQDSPLTAMPRQQLERSLGLDARRYAELDRQMEEILGRFERSGLFAASDRRPLSAADEELLANGWGSFYDCAFALDQIRIFYEDWYRFDPSRAHRDRLLRSFLLTFAAELSLYENSLRLVRLVQENPQVERFLDAPHPDLGLPEGTFGRLRQEFQGARDQARVLAGEQYMAWLEATLAGRGLPSPSTFGELSAPIDDHLAEIRRVDTLERLGRTLGSDAEILRRSVRRVWYPTQTQVAAWLGDTRTRRAGRYLIGADLLRAAGSALEPGDILLGRKNWYLSNVGLPGFWPHAILNLGPAEAFEAYFDTPEVRDWVTRTSGREGGLGDLLRYRHPSAWRRYTAAGDGPRPTVLEAIGDGVVLNTLGAAAGDYLAGLRPRLDKLAKAQAIAEAFDHLGKPYDFDFDFATDHALVCTELVWRAYRPADGKAGLRLPVRRLAGRLTLPANDIARLYADEHGSADAQLDLVVFVDAREREQRAFVADEAAFRASHQRFKWDLMLD